MSKIEDLISPGMEVVFRDEKFKINSGFTIEENPAIQMAFGPNSAKVKAEGLKLLLKVIAKRLYSEATEDQISKIDAKYTADLMDVFFQLDKSTPEDVKRIKKILEKRS